MSAGVAQSRESGLPRHHRPADERALAHRRNPQTFLHNRAHSTSFTRQPPTANPHRQLVSLNNISLRLASSPLRTKVRFIHLNQSNPLLREKRDGIVVARDGERVAL